MVNNNPAELLVYATPGLASLVVACAAWWAAPGRAGAIPAVTASVRRYIPAALVALISVTLGVVAYAGHAPGLTGDRALEGGVVAFLASALPLSLYWLMGRVLRPLVAVVMAWAVGLAPLYYYALIASLIVVGYTQCGPGSTDCPLG
jgi:hypothetical protein